MKTIRHVAALLSLAALGACGGGGGGSAGALASAQEAKLGTGMWANGEPFGTPGQNNHKMDKKGQNSLIFVAPPGVESFVGRYNLKVGGTWSTTSDKDLGGGQHEITQTYNFPVDADVLVIDANGTWLKQFSGTKTKGRWIDLGQNVAQLIGFDGDDWTASVQPSPGGVLRMEVRSPLGQNEWGRRF